MVAPILSQRDLEFMLYEFLDAEALCARERYADHNRETFQAAIDTARTVAEKYLLPIRTRVDKNEPTFDGKRVHMIPEIKTALDAIIDAGLAFPAADYEGGGMQLPTIVASAANGYLSAAGSTTIGYIGLTVANCNTLEAHASRELVDKWVPPMRAGRFMGTMAMTEPGAGSGLADLTTSAQRAEDGSYRISGSKIYISGGDHELAENIVHLVLARVKGAPKGVKGISLFLVPKLLVNDDGSLGERNDVWLAGLFHKMGGRGQTSCAMSFGEKEGAVGYLIGEENKGLAYMFHMMNEARIMVGTGAALTALTGYQYSLDYAKERSQGRLPSCKDPHSPPVTIIEHADVKRMLLAQKAFAEGAYALCLYGAQLNDDEKTAPTEAQRQQASLLLDFLTPIIKSWPSEYGPRANSLAIQVLGGAGYVNDHPVEMFYRDNRLNPIHEGTYGIQSLDLLGRKVPMKQMAGYHACLEAIAASCTQASADKELAAYADELRAAVQVVQNTTDTLLGAMAEARIDLALANSVKYLELFGNVVVAWIWLQQGMAAQRGLAASPHRDDENFYRGKMQALKYFYRFELPKIHAWSDLLCALDDTTLQTEADWF
ncbi:MAG: acyl-CoA dehydrogenase [Pseudomonadales bacterium]